MKFTLKDESRATRYAVSLYAYLQIKHRDTEILNSP